MVVSLFFFIAKDATKDSRLLLRRILHMEECGHFQETARNIYEYYISRPRFVIFNSVKQKHIFKWLMKTALFVERRDFGAENSGMDPIVKKNGLFFFVYNEIFSIAKGFQGEGDLDLDQILDPFDFLIRSRSFGMVLHDTETMTYCFVGHVFLFDFLNMCKDHAERSVQAHYAFPPLFSQMLDFQFDGSDMRGAQITRFIYFKHFANWFNSFRDVFDVSVVRQNILAHDSNVVDGGYFCFSGNQTSLHASLVTLMIIDFIVCQRGGFCLNTEKTNYIRKLTASSRNLTVSTLYLCVRKLFMFFDNDKHDNSGEYLLEADKFEERVGRDNELMVPVAFPRGMIDGVDVCESESVISLYHLASIQIGEIVRCILKCIFSRKLMGVTNRSGYDHVVAEFRRRLYDDAKVVISHDDFVYLYVSSKKIFDLRTGNLTHLFRLYMNVDLVVDPFSYEKSCGVSDMATSAATETLAGGNTLSAKVSQKKLTESIENEDLDALFNEFERISGSHGTHMESEKSTIYEATRSRIEKNRKSGVSKEGIWGLVKSPLKISEPGVYEKRKRTDVERYPYCTNSSHIGSFQYHRCDFSSFRLEIPRRREGEDFIPIPESDYKIRASSISGRKKFQVLNEVWEFDVGFQMRLFALLPKSRYKKMRETKRIDEEREVYLDMSLTHMSIADVLFTLTFYQTRFPFVHRSDVSITYEVPEVCILKFPDGVIGRIQKLVPMWMHYLQVAPQKSIMAPILMHNFLCSINTSDIAGMLIVAESIYNLVSGNRERLIIHPISGTVVLFNGKIVYKWYPGFFDECVSSDSFSQFASRMYLKHMATLPMFISQIDYNGAILSPYKDVSNFTSSRGLKSKKSDKRKERGEDGNPPEASIKPDELIFQFHPCLPTIYSAIRAFVNVTSPHLLSLEVFKIICKRFARDPTNSLRYPAQNYLIRYIQVVGEDKTNITQLTGPEDGQCVDYIILPPYYDEGLISREVSRKMRIYSCPYRATPLSVQFYPLMLLFHKSSDEVLEFFLGLRVYDELKDFVSSKHNMNGGVVENKEITTGNYIPPNYAYSLSETEGVCFSKVFDRCHGENIAEKNDGSSNPRGCENGCEVEGDLIHRLFYHFLYYTEVLAHTKCVGLTAKDAWNSIKRNGRNRLFTPVPFYKGHDTGDVSSLTYRGAFSAWNAIPQIADMMDFDVFVKYDVLDPCWGRSIVEFYRETVVDRVFFSRVDPMKYAQAISKNIPFFSLSIREVDKKRQWNEDPTRMMYDYLTLNVSPDNDLGEYADRLFFPILSTSKRAIDPTDIRNEDGPLFGCDAFIPFALGVAPITRISTESVKI